MNQIAIRCPMRETHPVRTQPAEMLPHQAKIRQTRTQPAKMLTHRIPTTKMHPTEMYPAETI